MAIGQLNLLAKVVVFISLVATALPGTVSASDLSRVQKQSASAPAQTSQFGQLVGHWKITDTFIDAKGK